MRAGAREVKVLTMARAVESMIAGPAGKDTGQGEKNIFM
jgi:hypothetical protein